MRKKPLLSLTTVVIVAVAVMGSVASGGDKKEPDADDLKKAESTKADAIERDSSLQAFFDAAAGYAVFPKVAKGAIGIGGAHGGGLLFEGGEATGKTKVTQVTIGLQLGGKTYGEIVFFENDDVLTVFKTGRLELAAQASAVALSAGVSADLAYSDGMAIVVMGQGGLMYEASIGGQKFSYKPFVDPEEDDAEEDSSDSSESETEK
jgi:lipid-binding SYLF domain-containing protein